MEESEKADLVAPATTEWRMVEAREMFFGRVTELNAGQQMDGLDIQNFDTANLIPMGGTAFFH